MESRNHHADRVVEVAQSGTAAARSRLAASWRRSMVKHGLDPTQDHYRHRLGDTQLKLRKEALEPFLRIAAPQLDRLYSLLGMNGCGVVLTDAEGVILEQRYSEGDAAIFETWGLWEGADWSEAREGTNGIGTCLAEGRRLIVHRDEHFHPRNIAMSCIDAPIYGADGQLLAALDVSSARADQTEAINKLIAATVAQTVRQIEAEHFRASFPESRIVVVESGDADAAALLAVDGDDIVVGATREARRRFDLGNGPLVKARPARDLLESGDGPSGFERAERAAVKRALARAGGNVSQAARALGIGRATLYRRMKRLGLLDSGAESGETGDDLSQG
ncbi:GAF domain-containing protein [Tropicimonas isoalkanivorans]|uniref:GAF domain-containing protein n=1 Tax=Tropicimonas isoalkanivorans TaxID=441112 RepID=A0A1I1EBU2_9RHOB|nr:GAF domain-containing protein [Tropicimonas isoalkanivorans]SFB84517.1 GAF domain-containing protein [Tropicimonas isoalkanivorans]